MLRATLNSMAMPIVLNACWGATWFHDVTTVAVALVLKIARNVLAPHLTARSSVCAQNCLVKRYISAFVEISRHDEIHVVGPTVGNRLGLERLQGLLLRLRCATARKSTKAEKQAMGKASHRSRVKRAIRAIAIRCRLVVGLSAIVGVYDSSVFVGHLPRLGKTPFTSFASPIGNTAKVGPRHRCTSHTFCPRIPPVSPR